MSEGPPEGFIALHRRIRDHAYWHDPERLRAWLDIIFMAAWRDHEKIVEGRRVFLRRGEFLASERYLRNRWRWSRGKVRRFLEAAQEANEIEPRNSTSGGTIYLVVNYDTYQIPRPTNRPTNGTTNGPPTDQREEVKEVTTTTKRKTRARQTRLPGDWEPTDEHEKRAREAGIDLGREAEKFRAHAEANDRRQVRWNAAFTTWLMNAEDWGHSKRGRNGSGPDSRASAGATRGKATGTDGVGALGQYDIEE